VAKRQKSNQQNDSLKQTDIVVGATHMKSSFQKKTEKKQ